jgi:hypothetical protein
MKATREQILRIVKEALQEDQEAISGKKVELTEDTRPLEELPSFDSLASVAVTARCLSALGLDDKAATVFVGEDKAGKLFARSLREVVDHIAKLKPAAKEGEENDE